MASEEQEIQAPLRGDQEIRPSPRVLSILPTPDMVLFPRMILPLVLWDEPAQKLVQEALFQDKIIGILAGLGEKAEGFGPENLPPGRHRRRYFEDAEIRGRRPPPAGPGAVPLPGGGMGGL